MKVHDKLKFKERYNMKGIRIELLGIGMILLGIAISTNNFFGYIGGVLGFGVIAIGCFCKDKKD